MDLARLVVEGIPEVPMLIPDLLQRAKVHSLWGPGGSGKSIFSAWIMVELARNGCRTLHLDSENGIEDQLERLVQLGADADLLSYMAFYSYPGLTLENADQLLRTARHERVDLVIFDSWISYLAGAGLDENSNHDVRRWLKVMCDPLKAEGIASFIIDHTPHDGDHPKGAIDKINGVDVSIKYTATKFNRSRTGTAMLRVRKDRHSKLPDVQKYTIGGDGTGRIVCGPEAIVEYGVAEVIPTKYRPALKTLEDNGGSVRSAESWRLLTDHRSKRSWPDIVTWLVDNGWVERDGGGYRLVIDMGGSL